MQVCGYILGEITLLHILEVFIHFCVLDLKYYMMQNLKGANSPNSDLTKAMQTTHA